VERAIAVSAVPMNASAGSVEARPAYVISRLSKRYKGGEVAALEDVDFTLARGEFVAIIGPSGCGKSTLLKIMAGLLPPTSGRVTLDGTPVTGPREDIGMMFQQATLLPWKTALENIVMPIQIREGRAAARAATPNALAFLDLVGLRNAADRYPGELSGGMAQRVAICRMLISEPTVLLLDEPFSALDELARDFLNMELQRICMERRATAFLVTHSIPEAVILSDRIVVMQSHPGRVAEIIDIDLPRPRTLEMINTARFGDIVAHIRSRFDKEGFL